MSVVFYISGAVAVVAAMLVVTRTNAMHALISLIVAFLAVSGVLWSLGAAFAAALQIVVYAGAIMVLFVFAVMLLNLDAKGERIERSWLGGMIWMIPAVLAAGMLGVFAYTFLKQSPASVSSIVEPQAVGKSLFSTYLIAVELASVLLLAGLVVGAVWKGGR
jgi:NADH-quinone oxidoreductase subunit J